MAGIASLIGGVLGAGASIYGGLQSAKALKEARARVVDQQQRNEDWYNRRYNEDATQRADAQRLLTRTEDAIRARNRAAAGTAAVMGGTDESVAATQARNAESLANATAQIAAQGDARKDEIEQQYMQRDQQYDNSLNNLQLQKANNIAESTKGLSSSFGTLGGAVDDYLGAK
jgi:hypothetical protein